MTWVQLVVRPDSIIRYWSTGQVKVGSAYAAVHDSPRFHSLPFRTHLFFSNGATMVRAEEMGALSRALIEASKDDPSLFLRLGSHFESLGHEWLDHCKQRFTEGHLRSASDDELANQVRDFSAHLANFAPILYVPFVVERRYSDEFPALLERVASKLRAELELALGSSPILSQLQAEIEIKAPTLPEIADRIRPILEYSPRRTEAEKREEAILRLAASVEGDSDLTRLFAADGEPSLGAISTSSQFLSELNRSLEEFGWMKQWGFPSHHSPFTASDFLVEIHQTLRRGSPRAKLDERGLEDQRRKSLHLALVKWAALSGDERRLLEDINYYNFMRTYRMEILIRAENYAAPLFDEIDRRGTESGKLNRGDTYFMTPPEICSLLAGRPRPSDLDLRRDGEWALYTNSEGDDEFYVAERYDRFADSFLSVLDHRENARAGRSNLEEAFVGGKGAGLFRLKSAGADVPPFFVVTTRAFERSVLARHEATLASILRTASAPNVSLRAKSEELCAIVRSTPLSGEIESAVLSAFDDLGLERVAVRSSATVEDARTHSWAGRFKTELNVDRASLTSSLRDVWSSLFSESALLYAAHAKVDLATVRMAVVVQEMAICSVAGVANSVLSGGAHDTVEIEAAFGLGEAVVSGAVTPDRYLVQVRDGVIEMVDRQVRRQAQLLTPAGWQAVPDDRAAIQKLPEPVVKTIARAAKDLERSFGCPVDIEWSWDDSRLVLLQARPQTDVGFASRGSASPMAMTADVPQNAHLVLTGLRGKASAVWSGAACVLLQLSEADKFRDGDALIVHAATPAWDPVVFRAGALVTNEGGATSHAIRVANERGIPAVVGTTIATHRLASGDQIVIDTASDSLHGRVLIVPAGGDK